MEMTTSPRAYFSILRWRKDPRRDEARNVAVILVNVESEAGLVKSAPLSSVSPRLHEQGILDELIVSLERRVTNEFSLTALQTLRSALNESVTLTEPKLAVLPNGDATATVEALYKAYVAPEGGGSKIPTKGRVLDKVVTTLRKYDEPVKRGAYVKDYIFDVVLESSHRKVKVLEVLSFATAAKNWVPVEHDAGYFLRAIDQIGKPGMAVVLPPSDVSDSSAVESHKRVMRWFKKEKIDIVSPDTLVTELELDRQIAAAGIR